MGQLNHDTSNRTERTYRLDRQIVHDDRVLHSGFCLADLLVVVGRTYMTYTWQLFRQPVEDEKVIRW